MSKIKITPEFWEHKPIKEVGKYSYVGINPPHYLVNVSGVSGNYVHTWAINAYGAIIKDYIHIETFKKDYKERES